MQSVASALAEALQRQAPGLLCVGYSGGLDSTVLLHALAITPRVRERGLRAWHVHHGLHQHADQWAAQCATFCAELSVPLTLSRVTVPHGNGQGLEAAARRARHAAFVEGLVDGEVLVFAHHRDDQAETFLLRALRASGPDGLGAMREWREFGRGHLWRPLLEVSRAALEEYAAKQGLRWTEDPSNIDESFDRNFLRQRVMPLLRERWPQAGASFARSAALCSETADLLDGEDARTLAEVILVDPAGDAGDNLRGEDPASLSRSRLIEMPPARRARVLRRWIDVLGLPPLPANGVTQIESTLMPARPDASASFEWHGAVVHAWRDLLHADWVRPPLPDGWQAQWNGAEPLALPGGGTLRLRTLAPQGDFRGVGTFPDVAADREIAASCRSDVSRDLYIVTRVRRVATYVAPTTAGSPLLGTQASGASKAPGIPGGFGRSLRVHARRGGERITLPGRHHSHALKQVLQDLGVPPWRRARLPLVSTADGELLAAGDLVCSADFDQWLREHGARLHWRSTATDPAAD